MNKIAFTLSEVLIVIVIIGIVAAITLPSVINNTNKQEYVSRLQKTYSNLSQATNRIIAEEGSFKGTDGGWNTSSSALRDMYKKYLNNVKECDNHTSCIPDIIDYKNLNGTSNNGMYHLTNNYDGIVLQDGTFLSFLSSSGCNFDQETYCGDKDMCGVIHVDINGSKKPNQWGRDAFRFYISETGLYPTGCNWNKTCTGQTCTCKVLREGAMNY